jgi:hypothetical protein
MESMALHYIVNYLLEPEMHQATAMEIFNDKSGVVYVAGVRQK